MAAMPEELLRSRLAAAAAMGVSQLRVRSTRRAVLDFQLVEAAVAEVLAAELLSPLVARSPHQVTIAMVS